MMCFYFIVGEYRLVVQITRGGSVGSSCDALSDTKSITEHTLNPLRNVYKVKRRGGFFSIHPPLRP